MSSAAAWSYTHKATLWPLLGRADWDGAVTYGAPVVIDCDYSAESVRMVDAKGIEFTTRQILYTERDDVKQGDYILIGESAMASPIEAGAFEVRAVMRYADTLEGLKDDFKIAT